MNAWNRRRRPLYGFSPENATDNTAPPPFPTNTPSTPQYTTPFKQNTTKILVSIIIFTLVVTYIWMIIETSHLNMKKHRIYMHTVSQFAACPSVDFKGLEDGVRYPKEEAAGKKARTPFWSDLFPLPPHKENGRVILSLHLTLSHQRPPPLSILPTRLRRSGDED